MTMFALRTTTCDGQLYVCVNDVQSAVGVPALPFQIAPLVPQTPRPPSVLPDKDGYDWIEREGLLELLEWYADNNAPSDHLLGIGAVQRTLRKNKRARRAVARKNRWLIAYRQQYCCGRCNQLLHPHR